jgi:hypothetical protein
MPVQGFLKTAVCVRGRSRGPGRGSDRLYTPSIRPSSRPPGLASEVKKLQPGGVCELVRRGPQVDPEGRLHALDPPLAVALFFRLRGWVSGRQAGPPSRPGVEVTRPRSLCYVQGFGLDPLTFVQIVRLDPLRLLQVRDRPDRPFLGSRSGRSCAASSATAPPERGHPPRASSPSSSRSSARSRASRVADPVRVADTGPQVRRPGLRRRSRSPPGRGLPDRRRRARPRRHAQRHSRAR